MEYNCSVCGSKLKNPASMEAGIGPICLIRNRFSEFIEDEKLIFLMNSIETLQSLKENSTVLIKLKNNKVILSYVLNIKDSYITILNKKGSSKEYKVSKSMSKSIYNNILKISKEDIDYFSKISVPKDPDTKREFLNFNKYYNELLKEKDNLKKNIIDLKINKFYHKIYSKTDLTAHQKTERFHLLSKKEKDPTNFNNNWNKGYYQRNTWIYRLENTNNKYSKTLAHILKNKKSNNIEIKDYGLTDEEIYTGLKHSSEKMESLIFHAYINNNKNIKMMIKLYINFDKLVSPALKIKTIKAMTKMDSGIIFTKEMLKKELET